MFTCLNHNQILMDAILMPRMKTKLFTIKYYQALFLNLGFCHLICKSVWPQKRHETLFPESVDKH